MDRLLIELPWPPSVNHYYRRVGHRTLISREGRKYRTEICTILRDLHLGPIDGELAMTVDAYPPDKRRRDADNILKSLLDALQHAGAYHDDSQIKKLSVELLTPHRLVIEEILGRPLRSDEVVHHCNFDKLDNRPENLVVMSREEHAALHSADGEVF